VTESRYETDGPTENPTDEYTLSIEVEPVRAGDEVEPNDVDSDAQPIGAATPVTGWLGRHHDVDRFRFDGGAGSYTIEVTGADSAPLFIRVGDGEARRERRLDAALEPGKIIALERRDPVDPAGGRPIALDVGEPYLLTIRPTPR
jgi:hypothetical protein